MEPANVQCLQGKEKIPLVTIIGKKRMTPLTVVFEGNLKTRINGIPERLEMSGSARGPIWPEVDEVLGPGQWWPGRLGDEEVPGPKWWAGGICAGVATEAGVTGSGPG